MKVSGESMYTHSSVGQGGRRKIPADIIPSCHVTRRLPLKKETLKTNILIDVGHNCVWQHGRVV